MPSVLQPWVENLTYMQQGVLVASIRGPDGIEKNHISKRLIRWLRRCTLHMAFESAAAHRPIAYDNPCTEGGGSFTGPSHCYAGFEFLQPAEQYMIWVKVMNETVDDYFHHLDEIPHHFHLHFMHAAEVIGYKHPVQPIRDWWCWLYKRLANDMHLNPETEEQMNKRLGDSERNWRAAEEVTAK